MILGAALTLTAISVALPGSSAFGKGPPSKSFGSYLRELDERLRFEIETGPAELSDHLVASAAACKSAMVAERDGRDAGSKWADLAKIVRRGDQPETRMLIAGFNRSHMEFQGLRKRFAAKWSDRPSRVEVLVEGVNLAARGVRQLQTMLRRTNAAYPRWQEHGCAAAEQMIELAAVTIPGAVDQVGIGMERLWPLTNASL